MESKINNRDNKNNNNKLTSALDLFIKSVGTNRTTSL